MFLVERFSVPDVSSEKIISFLFCPDPENLFVVVIVSRSRLDSEGFPVLQLTDKDTLHRPIQHGWTDLPVPPPLEIVLIFLSRLGWPRHSKTCRSRRELDNQGIYLFVYRWPLWRAVELDHLCGVENVRSAQDE